MSQVYFAPDGPEMHRASEEARKTFRYFWRELSWENRRLIPALGLACVKIPFSDPPDQPSNPDGPSVEEMWVNEVNFDGRTITGTLLNSPNWLTSVQEGDETQVPLSGISDWMYAINDRVYGAYTVNLMRLKMSKSERKQHDNAWGLDFGDPSQIQVIPADWFGGKPKGGIFSKLFGAAPSTPPVDVDSLEHPMSVNMGSSLSNHLKENPSQVNEAGEGGWTFLHRQALAGDLNGVTILLAHGANPNVVTDHGMTPLQLARSLNWSRVADALKAKGAK